MKIISLLDHSEYKDLQKCQLTGYLSWDFACWNMLREDGRLSGLIDFEADAVVR